jgi:2-keto-4-pentenoate hydratase
MLANCFMQAIARWKRFDPGATAFSHRRVERPAMTVPLLHDDLAARLLAAQAARRGIDPPAELAALTLAEAYAVQDALAAAREASGVRRAGWKLGITSPVKQRVMGIAHPLFGRMFADGDRTSGTTAALADFVAPRTEPEIVIGLASDIDPAMDHAALAAAIAWIAPALEITDSRYRSGTRTAVELVADNTSSSAYVIGPRIAAAIAPDYAALPTELVRNGAVVLRGSTADVLDHPLNALTALATHLAARGLRAGAGDVILSGAITDAIPVRAGDTIEARIAGLGVASVSFH